jgi:Glycosyl transferases, related to UDP-glucuronosyltransferase
MNNFLFFDVSDHKNLKVFMTHCGISSYQEAMHVGVPFIGIPIFGDQVHNCIRAVNSGAGVILDYDNITEDSVTWALKEVLQRK